MVSLPTPPFLTNPSLKQVGLAPATRPKYRLGLGNYRTLAKAIIPGLHTFPAAPNPLVFPDGCCEKISGEPLRSDSVIAMVLMLDGNL